MKKEYMYDYLFHFNHHTQVWAVFKRDKKDDYFNKGEAEYKSNKIETLLEILNKIYQ